LRDKIRGLQKFYTSQKALVTSPFITQFGEINRSLIEDVFKRLQFEIKNNIIVDVGCGTGLFSYVFSSYDLYIGIDIVRQPGISLSQNQRRRFIVADAQALPLKESVVDLLLCIDSFEHYPDQKKAADEFFRTLKEKGELLLSVPNYSNIAGIVKKIMERYILKKTNCWAPFDYWQEQQLEHFITPAHIKKVFSKSHFSQYRLIGYQRELLIGLFPWAWHPMMPPIVLRIMDRCFRPFSQILVRIFPALSLHLFWKITKIKD